MSFVCVCVCVAHTGEPCKNSWTNGYAVRGQIHLGWWNHVLIRGCSLALPGEYDWTIRVWWLCSLCQFSLTTLSLFSLACLNVGWHAESCAANLEQLCEKCARCFTDGIAAFESVSDVVNMALLHSNRGKLMRLQAQSVTCRLSDAKKREFTSAERNYFLQVTVLTTVCMLELSLQLKLLMSQNILVKCILVLRLF